MKAVNSFDEVRTYIAKVRSLRKGFLTNFFPEQKKIDIWTSHECLYVVEGGETAIFLKKDDGFTYILYCATTKAQLFDALASLPEDAYVFDQIVDARTDASLLDGFKSLGFEVRKSLVRMSRINTDIDRFEIDDSFNASETDLPLIEEMLHVYFDKYSEQLPSIEELSGFLSANHIIVKKIDAKIAGLILYDQTPTTIHWRYWLVNPEFRGQGVGSMLHNEYNRRASSCKRQILWVVEDNYNAKVRHEHYGYQYEAMKDYVLTKNIMGETVRKL